MKFPLFTSILVSALLWQYSFAQETFDLAAVQRIRNEALTKSKVMSHAFLSHGCVWPAIIKFAGLKTCAGMGS